MSHTRSAITTLINIREFCLKLVTENFLHAKESATLRKMYVAPHYTHRLFLFFLRPKKKKQLLEMKDILRSPTSCNIHNPVRPRLPRCRNTSQGCVETRHPRARPRSRASSTLAPSPPLATPRRASRKIAAVRSDADRVRKHARWKRSDPRVIF